MITIYQDSENNVYVIILDDKSIHIEAFGAKKTDLGIFVYSRDEARYRNYEKLEKMNKINKMTNLVELFEVIFNAKTLTINGWR